MKLKGEDKMILKKLKIKTWVGDPTNCYVIFDEDSKEIKSLKQNLKDNKQRLLCLENQVA